MHTLSVMLLLVMVSLTVSLVCWLVLGVSLRRVLAFLCNDPRDEVKEISGIFWQRLYLSLTLFTPLLCVLLFAPNFERSLADNLLCWYWPIWYANRFRCCNAVVLRA